MSTDSFKAKQLKLSLDVTELNEHQVRLAKSIISMLNHVMTIDDEEEYFDHSSELMRMVASAVKKANFPTHYMAKEKIPYARQAIEFSLDNLTDHLFNNTICKFDN